MISSRFLQDILDLITDDKNYDESLRKQIAFLTPVEIEHTGIGVFINFKNDYNITPNLDVNLQVLDGVEILNDEHKVLADAILHLEKGLISQLEIFNKNGYDYPKVEIQNYIMKQTWIGSNNRVINNKAII